MQHRPNGSSSPSPSDAPSVQQTSFQDRKDSLLKRLGHLGMHALDGLFGAFSTVGDRPVHDPSQFPWTTMLEAHWREMRDELDAILEHREALPSFHDIAEDASTISQDDNWKTFFLDVKRPMREPMATVNDLVLRTLRHTPVVQNARENQKQWSKRLDEIEAQPA